MHRALCRLAATAARRGARATTRAYGATPALRVTRAERTAKAALVGPDARAIAALFDQLQRGAATMVGVAVTRDDAAGTLSLHGPRGVSFLLTTESTAPPSVRLQSTASTGLAKSEMFYTYRHDAATGQWVCVDTGHFLIELLTRDCVFHFQGVPSW